MHTVKTLYMLRSMLCEVCKGQSHPIYSVHRCQPIHVVSVIHVFQFSFTPMCSAPDYFLTFGLGQPFLLRPSSLYLGACRCQSKRLSMMEKKRKRRAHWDVALQGGFGFVCEALASLGAHRIARRSIRDGGIRRGHCNCVWEL